MSERYSKLFSLPENLYAKGAPVIVSAGNLLKDNQTGKVLAQLKIKNIAARPLKAATVLIHPQDTAGKPMANDTQQIYLDLTAKTGEEFGQKTAVFLPDDSTRGFSVEVTQAVFADNSTWDGTAAPWEPLPPAESLSGKLGDAELLKQYRIKFGGKCEAVPQVNRDLWRCACGEWNKNQKCYSCGKEKDSQILLEIDALKAEKDARLAKEKAEREAKEAADKAAAEAKAKKTKKLLSVLIPAVVLCAAAVLFITKVIAPNINYNKAVSLIQKGQYEEAIILLRRNVDYKDSRRLILQADHGIQEEKRIENEARIEAEKAAAYEKAEELLNAGDYDAAIAAFQKLNNYRDSATKIEEAKTRKYEAIYQKAETLKNEGNNYEAALAFSQITDYLDAWQQCTTLWGDLTTRKTIAAGGLHSVALLKDGTVVAVGSNKYGQCNTSNWQEIIAVSAGLTHTVALKSDGTVVAVGNNESGQCDVENWRNIVAIDAGSHHTIGLCADGTVITAGSNKYGQRETEEWQGIIDLAAGGVHTLALRADGTVVAVGYNKNGECDVSSWRGIISIAAATSQSIGLKSDGTVVVAGHGKDKWDEWKTWHDVVAVDCGNNHLLAQLSDGTVVATGNNRGNQCEVSDWTDIIEISAGYDHNLGLKSDGTVAASGINSDGECIVNDWKSVKLPE